MTTGMRITIEGDACGEEGEYLEDAIADALGMMGLKGKLYNSGTGNIVVFPSNRAIHDGKGHLHRMFANMMEKWNAPDEICCPKCGSGEVFTSEDDDEMRECNECGYLWEIDPID